MGRGRDVSYLTPPAQIRTCRKPLVFALRPLQSTLLFLYFSADELGAWHNIQPVHATFFAERHLNMFSLD